MIIILYYFGIVRRTAAVVGRKLALLLVHTFQEILPK